MFFVCYCTICLYVGVRLRILLNLYFSDLLLCHFFISLNHLLMYIISFISFAFLIHCRFEISYVKKKCFLSLFGYLAYIFLFAFLQRHVYYWSSSFVMVCHPHFISLSILFGPMCPWYVVPTTTLCLIFKFLIWELLIVLDEIACITCQYYG